ncbi:MAG TPA: NEW3 domain-containing protein [Actinophytocola sp.]|uniref:glycoside hydrolase family 38 N-terminal domain-containing protein n=1 Tax=Actinophytocola sp. TaxID=1872138 RepID=UPI002DBCFC5B|nr:NEW3 domain-containing protein [Actinophytocola sp.]HEU5473047.1 NEW3 domain-containing protein [Actinophytocola sp.]
MPDAVTAESTELFTGDESAPLQVVRVTTTARAGGFRAFVEGPELSTPAAVESTVEADGPVSIEIPVDTRGAPPGATRSARAVVETGGERREIDFDLVVAEPGWTMHMVSHFHYDPVWWNTQAAYTVAWDRLDFPGSPRGARQLAGFDLVRAHLDIALAEPEYRFVLAEVDYLKPYWDAHPEDRAVLRRLLAEGRVEIMGGAYNEPNTNLTNPETTIRNFVHGMGFQRDVLGADPRTSWQLDVFGHDPAFPGFAADAGLTSSSWARGPFHQWGPMERTEAGKGDPRRMQFASEFEWISPSGRGLLTAYMTDHYGAGWVLDSAPTLHAAEAAAFQVFTGLKPVASTRNVLLPVGGDYTPPNKWITQIHRDWNARYTWPRFVCALPRDFFAAVRAELDARGEAPTPQTRDMNPIYTGKDVSFIDTKQAQRAAEFALLEAEPFAVFANLLAGARYPDAALAKAWVQLAYGAHHDGITGSESDQVYLDLLTGWRDAHDLATGVRAAALTVLSGLVECAGEGTPVVVWNPLTHERTDVVTVRLADSPGTGVSVLDEAGTELPALVEHGGHTVTFLAYDVPPMGWRTFRVLPADRDDQGWTHASGVTAANDTYLVALEPSRGGGVTSLVERATGRELITDGRLGNELAVYEEYPQHPRFGEGPWHLLPKGPVSTSGRARATVDKLASPAGERLVVRGTVGPVRYTQTITLWHGVSRVDCVTTVDEFTGSDQLLRVRWPCEVPGALPVSEVGNAVVGRGFGLIDVDSAEHPWTLDNPAHTWFGLSAPAALRLAGGALRPVGVAEIIVPSTASAAPLARELAVALARSGVTATVSTADGSRYGDLGVDSNLPDVRIAIGGRDDNPFIAELLDRAGLDEQPGALRWVPPDKPLAEVWRPSADLRDARALGVLVVPAAAVGPVVADLADHVIEVGGGDPGQDGYAGRTVALLNRGMPGFAVDSSGTLHASLMRSCTGWPSGVWIDPPRRTAPDGSNFQLQHWTHEFGYAVVSGDGDWRAAGIAAASAEYGHPLLAVLPAESGGGPLAGSGSLLEVEPAGRVRLGALKAAGNPLTQGSAAPADPRNGVALRLVAHTGEPVLARVGSPLFELTDARRADLLERPGEALAEPAVPVAGCDAVTIVVRPEGFARTLTEGPVLGPEAEPAQPLFAKYWLHNRGPAPLGGLPAAVHLEPAGADRLRLTVASDRTDGELHGFVRLAVPDGWRAEPAEIPFGLAAGGHLVTDLVVTAPPDAAPGAHPVRARLELTGAGLPPSWLQPVEDVAVLTVPGGTAPLLALATDPAPVRLGPGERGRISVRVRSGAHAPVAVEAALVCPWGTWELAGPRAVGAEVPALGEAELGFDIAPPPWTPPGRWWALIKVAGAGVVLYSPAVALEIS